MNVADIITRIRLDVNDLDADRWENAHLVDILNEAQCEMYNIRPDLFQEIVVAQLDEGEWQQPCCCGAIAKLDGIADVNGVKIDDIRAVEQAASVAFGKRRKCGHAPYPSEYGLERSGGSRFWVNPPVRPDQTVFVRIVCAVKPEPLGFDLSAPLGKVGCEYYGALIDFALFRLLGTETESLTSREKSAFHRAAFYEKLGLHSKIKRDFKADGKEKTA